MYIRISISNFSLGLGGSPLVLHSGLKQYRDPLKTPFLVFENCLFEEKVLKMHEYCKNVEFGKRKKKLLYDSPGRIRTRDLWVQKVTK